MRANWMPKATDAVVAGGGLMGLMSAYYLARKGLSVRLLEAGAVGREASWAGGGILWPLYAWEYPQAVQAMAQRGRDLYPELCRSLADETGIDPQYLKSGLLVLDSAQQAHASEWCGAVAEPFESASVAQLEPALSASWAAHPRARLADVAQVRNPRLCQALAHALAQMGVFIHADEPVTAVESTAGKFRGLRTHRALYSAKYGVVATGAWASQLVPQCSLYPVKGQMLLIRADPGQLGHILLSEGRYVIPRKDGHLLVGSTVERAGFSRDTDVDTRMALKEFFDALLPGLASAPVVQHWAGLRPATDSGVPYVGPVAEINNLFINAGHYRNGVVMAPASAELLAALITHNAADSPLNPGHYTPQ